MDGLTDFGSAMNLHLGLCVVNALTLAKKHACRALMKILRRYSLYDTLNADETSLFYKLMLDRKINYKGDST